MKQGIHPQYVECTVTCSCGNTFKTHATVSEMKVELCNGETLDDILPEAFAAVREARRVLGMRHFPTCRSSAASCCTRAASPR